MSRLLSIPDVTFRGRYRNFTLRAQDLVNLAFYCGLWLALFFAFPGTLLDHRTRAGLLIIGVFGTWRYSWWLVNFVRSQYFGRAVYPKMRAQADGVWQQGWRSGHVHFIMTT